MGQQPLFLGSLKGVSEALDVPYSWVIRWREQDNCPVLKSRPYDLRAIQLWLTRRANIVIDPSSKLSRNKLQAEVDEIQNKDKIFSRDHTFWMAVMALGISVSKEVRDWLQSDSATSNSPKRVQRTEVLPIPVGSDKKVLEEFQHLIAERVREGHSIYLTDTGDAILATAIPLQGDSVPATPIPVQDDIKNLRIISIADKNLDDVVGECRLSKETLLITDRDGKAMLIVSPD